MISRQKAFYEAKRTEALREIARRADPFRALIEAADKAVDEATKRAEDVERAMEELRPVWAQGFTSDSIAAQSSASALAEIWKLLGVDNQTAAMEKLRAIDMSALKPAAMGHATRYSDSSLYDEICTQCGLTDTGQQNVYNTPCNGRKDKA